MTIQIQEFEFFINWVPTSIGFAYIIAVLYYTHKFANNDIDDTKQIKKTMLEIKQSNQKIIEILQSH